MIQILGQPCELQVFGRSVKDRRLRRLTEVRLVCGGRAALAAPGRHCSRHHCHHTPRGNFGGSKLIPTADTWRCGRGLQWLSCWHSRTHHGRCTTSGWCTCCNRWHSSVTAPPPSVVVSRTPTVYPSEKDTKLAQKLGQLQPLIAVSYSHRNVWANLHLLGQPNTFLAPAGLRPKPFGCRPCSRPRALRLRRYFQPWTGGSEWTAYRRFMLTS